MLELSDLFESEASIYALVFGSIICILLLLAFAIVTSGLPVPAVRRLIAGRVIPVMLIVTALGAVILGAAFTKSGAKSSAASITIDELQRRVDVKSLPVTVVIDP